MKLLLDQGLPHSTASLLRAAGIDAVHTSEIGYATAEDTVLLAHARQDDRVVVTLDADFHTLLALSRASAPSVIRIRVERLRAKAAAELIRRILNEWSDELEAGVTLTVQPGRIRFRRLPLL